MLNFIAGTCLDRRSAGLCVWNALANADHCTLYYNVSVLRVRFLRIFVLERHKARAGVRIIPARVYSGKDGLSYRAHFSAAPVFIAIVFLSPFFLSPESRPH